jgi:crotonobetainyl-CoA:carnitine CoA-transferase CaiB-like acyl-CoA transferase
VGIGLHQARRAARFPAPPAGLPRGAPALGQHNEESLAELGYDESTIVELIGGGGAVGSEVFRIARASRGDE